MWIVGTSLSPRQYTLIKCFFPCNLLPVPRTDGLRPWASPGITWFCCYTTPGLEQFAVCSLSVSHLLNLLLFLFYLPPPAVATSKQTYGSSLCIVLHLVWPLRLVQSGCQTAAFLCDSVLHLLGKWLCEDQRKKLSIPIHHRAALLQIWGTVVWRNQTLSSFDKQNQKKQSCEGKAFVQVVAE